MLEVLTTLQEGIRIPTLDGRKVTLTTAALETDRQAFKFLNDSYIETKLLEGSCMEVERKNQNLKRFETSNFGVDPSQFC